MAIQTNFFPGGLLSGTTANPPLEELLARSGNDTIRNAAQQGFAGGDGVQVRINGAGLTYDAAGHITGGVITSIQFITIDQFNNTTVQAQVAGFAIAGVVFQNALNVSNLSAVQLLLNGPDTIIGAATADNLFGHNGADLLLGNGGDDTLTGGNGGDILNGGAGFDTADYSDSHGNPAAIKGVQINLGAGIANDWAGNGDTVISIERVIGTQFADTMIGTVANETFIGLEGNDGFVGNAGIDTVDYSLDAKFNGNAGVVANLTTGTGTDGFGATDLYSGIENLTGTNSDDKLTGSATTNILRGLGGNDVLDGVNVGVDQMIGGAGNDTYIFSNAVQVVDEVQDNGGGIDEVQSSISVDLRNTTQFKGDIENLTLTGAAAVVGIGNDLANIIKGNDIANILSGQSGDDTMSGGGGNDNMTGDGGNDTMDGGVGDDNMAGGTGNDKMTGGAGDDNMQGGDGNDRLDGGDGSNNLQGGLGDDVYVVGSHALGQDTINDAGGQHDLVESSITRDLRDYTGVEDATLTGNAAANLTGTNGDNVLTGNDGANVIAGLDGNDTINAGGGNDTVFGGGGNDTVDGGSGNDVIDGGDGNDSLSGGLGDDIVGGGAGDDSMTGGDGNDQLNGGAGNNSLDGGAGADALNGGIGNDTLTGGDGDDTAFGGGGQNSFFGGSGNDSFNGSGDTFDFGDGGAGNDVMNGSAGNDTFLGGDGDDKLFGFSGVDNLQGGAGNDLLVGGRGRDTLTGGDGRDIFKFDSKNAADRDTVRDFTHGQDKFQLSKSVFGAIGNKLEGNEFFNGKHAHDANDHIIYNRATGGLFYDSNGDHAGGEVQIATLSNHPLLTASDFVMV